MDDLWMCCGGGSSDGLRSNGVSLRGSVGIQTKALLGGRCSGVRTSNKNGEMMLAVKTELASAMSGDGDVIGVTLLKALSLWHTSPRSDCSVGNPRSGCPSKGHCF
jgi:hypothetical protein